MSAMGSQEDAYRPSLFELIAQEKLREMLQPAVQYVLAVCAWFLRFILALMELPPANIASPRFMLRDIRDF
jgi:hypothetical protein